MATTPPAPPDDPPPLFTSADAALSRLVDSLAGFVGWLQIPLIVFYLDGVFCKFVAPPLLIAYLCYCFRPHFTYNFSDLRECRTYGPTEWTTFEYPTPYWQHSRFLIGIALLITLPVLVLFLSFLAAEPNLYLGPLALMAASTALRWISFAYGRRHRRQQVALQQTWSAAQIASWREKNDPGRTQSDATSATSSEATRSPWRGEDTAQTDARQNESVQRQSRGDDR